jgi:signal transduction histidine kinase
MDVNLRCFVGRLPRLDASRDFSLYDLVDTTSLDGLILASDLGYGASKEALQRFCLGFAPLPMVAISLEVENMPIILPDNFNGMAQAVNHLLETHNYRRVAFIRGPENRFEAEQRYQAYLHTLKSHDLPFDENLVMAGDFSSESGRSAVRTLLDERHASFEAIVAANDRMAFGALDALQERVLQVPADIALVGFDDLIDAQSLGVPLTTVRQPFYTSGQQAVSTLLRLIHREKITGHVVMPTELVIRSSCGCLPPALRRVNSNDLVTASSTLESRREAVLSALSQTITSSAIPGATISHESITPVLSRLWDAFLSDLRGITQDSFPKAFAQALTIAQQFPMLDKGVSIWHGFLSEFRRQILPYLPDQQAILRAEDMLEQGRILIGEAAQRIQASQQRADERREELLQRLGTSLATLVSLKDVAEAARQNFPALGIERCHIALYDVADFGPLMVDPHDLNAKLFLKYARGEVELVQNGQAFPARQLAPADLLPQDRRYTAIISPLGLAQSPLGIFWNEVGPKDWEIHIRVINLLSSALFRAVLINQREKSMQEIGQLLVSAEQRSVELAIAKEVAEEAAHHTQTALQETEGLLRAARAILGATYVIEISQKFTDHLHSLVQVDQVLIHIVDQERKRTLLNVHNGNAVDDPSMTYEELSSGINGMVFRSGQPILSLGPEDEIEPEETTERRRHPGTGSIIAVPLITKGKVIGTVMVLNRIDQRQFNQHDLELLISLATQAATAIESARLYQAEQERRQVAEILVNAGRKLTSTLQLREVPEHILEQLALVVPYERSSLILQEDDNLRIVAQHGFPDDERTKSLTISIREGDVYQQVVAAGRPVIIDDVTKISGWSQVDWLPLNLSWMGVPLFSKEHVIGMLSLTRREVSAFSDDDSILASTFSLQAAIALENAGLYDEITRFNEQLEQMVDQRTEELNQAYQTLEKLDQNKTVFINVAAHELRTPLTVLKGYTSMIGNDPSVIQNAYLSEVVKGVNKGVNRLQGIINSMLDVARIDSQVLDLHPEQTSLPVTIKRIQSDLDPALKERQITLTLEDLDKLPIISADPSLLLKVFQNLIGNAVKYTPNGGRITVSGKTVSDDRLGECVEVLVQDTGIGIDPEYHELIFEKFYQTGTVALHSSSETQFKGGGPGLGLSIVRGIVQAHRGRIWVESIGHSEELNPGSTFHVLLPITWNLPG